MFSSNARARIDFLKDHPYGYQSVPKRKMHEDNAERAVSAAVMMRNRFQQHLELSDELTIGYNQGVGDKRRHFGDKLGEGSHGDGYPDRYSGNSRRSQGGSAYGTRSGLSGDKYS
jgi:hypothetical protein